MTSAKRIMSKYLNLSHLDLNHSIKIRVFEKHYSNQKINFWLKYINCHAFKHLKEKCWFKFSSMIMNGFHKLYSIQKARDKDRDEIRRIVVEWERTHLKKRMIIKSLIIRIAITTCEENKIDQWYISIAVVHITHDLILFMFESNSRIESIETVTKEKIQTRDADTINVNVILHLNEHTNVHLHDVHYCFEVNSNLLFLSELEEQGHTFNAKNSVLRVLDSDEDVVLVVNRERNVYVLHQLIASNQYSLSSILFIKSRSTSIETWYQRADHVNQKDLIQLPLVRDDNR
jgi:hypothetical protein